MKKLLLSLLTLGIASATAIGATSAYFSDQEVLGVNTIRTGKVAIDLSDTSRINLWNIMPGVWSPRQTFKVHNTDTNNPVIYKFEDQYVNQSIPGMYSKMEVQIFNQWNQLVYSGILANMIVKTTSPNLGFFPTVSPQLAPDATHTYYLQFRLNELTGNTFQNGWVQLNIVVDATQPGAIVW